MATFQTPDVAGDVAVEGSQRKALLCSICCIFFISRLEKIAGNLQFQHHFVDQQSKYMQKPTWNHFFGLHGGGGAKVLPSLMMEKGAIGPQPGAGPDASEPEPEHLLRLERYQCTSWSE